MTNPQVAYFFKKYYRNIIKWYFVSYSQEKRVISFSEADAEYSEHLAKEKERKQRERVIKYCEAFGLPIPEQFQKPDESNLSVEMNAQENFPVNNPKIIPNDAFNETTGSYSGLYGQQPVDAGTQSMLAEIMGKTGSQNSIDSLLAGDVSTAPMPEPEPPVKEEVSLSPEDADVIREANEIFERLMREAAEDEAKKQAEIEEAKRQAGV